MNYRSFHRPHSSSAATSAKSSSQGFSLFEGNTKSATLEGTYLGWHTPHTFGVSTHLMPKGNCKLCERNADLRESHVIPKSIYNWIKETSGTGILRSTQNINRPVQDGFKYYWLCENCEQKFGHYERYFIENIFRPINNDETVKEFNYDERLFYFICSIWWRIIHQSLSESEVLNCKFISIIRSCEAELKRFLHEFKYPLNFDRNFLLLLGEVKKAPEQFKNINFIFLRSIDPLLMFDDDSCYLSLRIPHFYFFGNIIGLNENMLKSVALNPSGGKYRVDATRIEESHLSNFIMERIVTFNSQMEKVSDTQAQKTSNRHKKNIDKWLNSKSYDAWIKDKQREKKNE